VDTKLPAFRLLPLCEEKKQLRNLYQLAVDFHRKAVDEALLARGRSKHDYERFRLVADEAKKNAMRSVSR
jgi:hypothetical protein